MTQNDSPLIMLVEDDALLARAVALGLQKAGYQTIHHSTPDDALRWLHHHRPDVMIFDVDLGTERNGFDLCRLIRTGGWTGEYVLRAEEYAAIPIMILTGKDRLDDKLTGYDAGTDDYMTKNDLFLAKKQVDARLLVARLQVLLRREGDSDGAAESTLIRIGPITIHLDRNEVVCNDQVLQLAATEYQLLCWLAQHPGIPQSQETLLHEVWGYDSYTSTRAVGMCVSRLRTKFKQAGAADLIHNRHGEGYYLAN